MAQFKGSNHQYDLTQEDEVCINTCTQETDEFFSEQHGVEKKF